MPHHHPLSELLRRAGLYLQKANPCSEDQLDHAGRQAYAFPIFKHLQMRDAAVVLSSQLIPYVRPNQHGATIIFPGREVRRNYSTNAIDCGIFLDSIHDFLELCPDHKKTWDEQVDAMALTYNANKIKGHRQIHNQYLWAGTGLARWVQANPHHSENERIKHDLIDTVKHWLMHVMSDGYAPYLSSPTNRALSGLTTYYHSRCIAFCFYILEQCHMVLEPYSSHLLRAAEFLIRLQRPSGVKQLLIECKRYYFWGPHEVASHSFEIYVYDRCHQIAPDPQWVTLGALAFQRLLEAQRPDGSLASYPGSQSWRDWQCPIMRTSHLAWLTRLTGAYAEAIQQTSSPSFAMPAKHFSSTSSDKVILVGSSILWTHFITEKAPLLGFAGGRASGLLLAFDQNINDLRSALPLHYELFGAPTSSLKSIVSGLKKTLKHVVYASFDWARYKRRPSQGIRIVWYQLVVYMFAALFLRRTEFATTIENLQVFENEIRHDLTATNLEGKRTIQLGKRIIAWKDSEITITDTIHVKHPLKTHLPKQWHVHGTHTRRHQSLVLKTPGTFVFTGNLGSLS